MGIDVGRRSIVEWASRAPEEGGEEFVPSAERFEVEAQGVGFVRAYADPYGDRVLSPGRR